MPGRVASRGEAPRQHSVYRNIVLGIVLALCLVMLILIFLLGNQWYHEREGDRHFRETRYGDAAESYQKAYDHARITGQERLLYKIGLSYQNGRDYDRARDYYFELVRLYPDANTTRLVGPRIDEIVVIEASPLLDPTLSDLMPKGLGAARQKFRKAYQHLHRVLVANRAGVSADLEAAYQAYKVYHEDYKRQIAEALRQYKDEHPGFVWPPPGAQEAVVPEDLTRERRADEEPPEKTPEEEAAAKDGAGTGRGPSTPRIETRPTDVERELSGELVPGKRPGGP